MHCVSCGVKNSHQARFCVNCGKGLLASAQATPALSKTSPNWMNVLGIMALTLLGLAGIYMHPLLEVAVAAYVAVAASAVWVFMDAPRHGMSRVPWTLITLGVWFFAFPAYLAKTRGAKGLVPGVAIVAIVLGMQFFPEAYSAQKHFRRGQIFAGQQRLSKAEEEFLSAIRRDNTLGEAHLNLGVLYMSQGLLDASEQSLMKAKDLLERYGARFGPGSKNQALSLCLAHLSAVSAMRTSEAIQILDRVSAKKYFAQAQKYAEEALKLDAGNVRSQELSRRLGQLSSLLQ